MSLTDLNLKPSCSMSLLMLVILVQETLPCLKIQPYHHLCKVKQCHYDLKVKFFFAVFAFFFPRKLHDCTICSQSLQFPMISLYLTIFILFHYNSSLLYLLSFIFSPGIDFYPKQFTTATQPNPYDLKNETRNQTKLFSITYLQVSVPQEKKKH